MFCISTFNKEYCVYILKINKLMTSFKRNYWTIVFSPCSQFLCCLIKFLTDCSFNFLLSVHFANVISSNHDQLSWDIFSVPSSLSPLWSHYLSSQHSPDILRSASPSFSRSSVCSFLSASSLLTVWFSSILTLPTSDSVMLFFSANC